MKNVTKVFLTTAMVTTMMLTFAACDNPAESSLMTQSATQTENLTTTAPTNPHTHTYALSVTDPTCTENGYTVYTCECGDTYQGNETAARGHTVVVDQGKVPTCTEAGRTEGTHCSVCNTVLMAQEIIPATGHVRCFWNPDNCYATAGEVTVTPMHVYYKDGMLVAECFVINGRSHAVYDVDVTKLAFYTANEELIAYGAFSFQEKLVMNGNSYHVCTFYFVANDVYIDNADLSQLLCSYETVYKW